MNFKPHTQKELEELNLNENETYTIEYINKDYFNGENSLEIAKAKVIINDTKYVFVVPDPYGMDRFINEARVII